MIYDFDLMIYYFLYRMTVLFELLPAIRLCLLVLKKNKKDTAAIRAKLLSITIFQPKTYGTFK
jgi:hypothetical protein